MRKFLVFLLALALVCSCGVSAELSRDYEHKSNQVDFHQKVRVDSIFVRDSIFIREKGDTVYKYVERWRVKERIIRDTIFIEKTDTLFQDRVEVQYVEKELNGWYKWQIKGFWILLAALVVFLLIKFRARLPFLKNIVSLFK